MSGLSKDRRQNAAVPRNVSPTRVTCAAVSSLALPMRSGESLRRPRPPLVERGLFEGGSTILPMAINPCGRRSRADAADFSIIAKCCYSRLFNYIRSQERNPEVAQTRAICCVGAPGGSASEVGPDSMVGDGMGLSKDDGSYWLELRQPTGNHLFSRCQPATAARVTRLAVGRRALLEPKDMLAPSRGWTAWSAGTTRRKGRSRTARAARTHRTGVCGPTWLNCRSCSCSDARALPGAGRAAAVLIFAWPFGPTISNPFQHPRDAIARSARDGLPLLRSAA
jgi:hypothetical protein